MTYAFHESLVLNSKQHTGRIRYPLHGLQTTIHLVGSQNSAVTSSLFSTTEKVYCINTNSTPVVQTFSSDDINCNELFTVNNAISPQFCPSLL